ncbi:hypothetical protein PMAYCL1PPCAC_14521, partial [Pristionchus mayeri]
SRPTHLTSLLKLSRTPNPTSMTRISSRRRDGIMKHPRTRATRCTASGPTMERCSPFRPYSTAQWMSSFTILMRVTSTYPLGTRKWTTRRSSSPLPSTPISLRMAATKFSSSPAGKSSRRECSDQLQTAAIDWRCDRLH